MFPTPDLPGCFVFSEDTSARSTVVRILSVGGRYAGRARVEIDPELCFGRSAVAGTAVATERLYEIRLAGEMPERIAEGYELPLDDVNAAIRYEDGLLLSNGLHPA